MKVRLSEQSHVIRFNWPAVCAPEWLKANHRNHSVEKIAHVLGRVNLSIDNEYSFLFGKDSRKSNKTSGKEKKASTPRRTPRVRVMKSRSTWRANIIFFLKGVKEGLPVV